MNRLDRQDLDRYWKLSQVKSSARYFAAKAETAFRQLLGHLSKAGTVFTALGSVFSMTGELLDEREKSLDRVLFDRVTAKIARRRAGRRRESARKAVRKVLCAIRQLVNSLTDGQADVYLGVRGDTPRHPEKIAAWGELFCDRLPEADLPPGARALVAAMVEELAPLVEELLEAIEQADLARCDERLAHAEVERVREEVDAELDKAVEFLRSSLRFAGQDYLASRVLGKRRGRPRGSTKAKKEAALQRAAAGGQEFDSAPQLVSEAGQEFDFAAQTASGTGGKLDSTVETEVPIACEDHQEIEKAPNRAFTASEEIAQGSGGPCTAFEKIAKAPCRPCTEPSSNVEVAQDTPKSTRQRRRRMAAAFLGASKRLLPSAWIGRFVNGDRRRGRERDRA